MCGVCGGDVYCLFVGLGDECSFVVGYGVFDGECFCFVGFVFECCGDVDGCLSGVYVWGCDVCAVGCDVCVGCFDQSGVSVDSCAGVPSGDAVVLFGVVDSDCEDVVAVVVEVGCEVVFYLSEAVGCVSERVSVYVDVGAAVDAVELYGDVSVTVVFFAPEYFAVPSYSSGQVSVASGVLWVEWL